MTDTAKVRAKLMEGLALQQAGHLAQAQGAYREVLQLAPRQFDALHLLGVIAAQMKDFAESVRLIDEALAVDATHAGAHYNRAIALEELRRFAAAIASYDQAIALKPDHAVAYNNRGVAQLVLKQYAAAIASFDKAIALQPQYAEAYGNRAQALSDAGRFEAALSDFDQALRLKPDAEILPGARLFTKMRICDWRSLDQETADLMARIQRGEKATMPWPVLALTGSLALQRRAAEIWAYASQPSNSALGPLRRRGPAGKIRVGYFSMDFREHPIAYLIAGLIRQHSRENFQIHAFSYGPETGDGMRRNMEAVFDTFVDVRNKTDQEIATLARDMDIDIAVDLAGYTTDARSGIFALRAAPIQVSYLGYAGTMGAPYIDYLLADSEVIPRESRGFYSEKIVNLPCYQANDNLRAAAPPVPDRATLGLPRRGFVFCCFNNNHKIMPAVFDGWMRILKQTEGSVLWLLEDNPVATANLRAEATRRGIAGERLIFAQRAPQAVHMARHGAADLFLDTLPYNAHTTASDALWAGLPVLTRAGDSFAGRVAASLLRAIGLPELVAATKEEYETRAVSLASNPEDLRAIKRKLEQNRLTTPLFDTAAFTRHVEAAYTRMYARHQANLPPDHIDAGL